MVVIFIEHLAGLHGEGPVDHDLQGGGGHLSVPHWENLFTSTFLG